MDDLELMRSAAVALAADMGLFERSEVIRPALVVECEAHATEGCTFPPGQCEGVLIAREVLARAEAKKGRAA